MSQDYELLYTPQASQGRELAEPAPPDPGPAPEAPPRLGVRVRRLIGGRYKMALLLMAAGALLGGIVGFQVKKLTYKATGQIHVPFSLPHRVESSDLTNPLANYDGFMNDQLQRLKDRPVTQAAARDPRWNALGPIDPEVLATALRADLETDRAARSEYITLIYADRDPDIAILGVNTVLDAYIRRFGGEDIDLVKGVLQDVEKIRGDLGNQLKALDNQIKPFVEEYGTDSLELQRQAKEQRRTEIEAILDETKTNIALAEAAMGNAPQQQPTTSPISPAQIALAGDEEMKLLLQQRSELEVKARELASTHKETHPELKARREQLELLNFKIDTHADTYRRNGGPVAGAGGAGALSRDQLRLRQKTLEARLAVVNKEVVELGENEYKLRHLRAEYVRVHESLNAARRRIDELKTEAPKHPRISISAYADKADPSTDRRKQMAAAGAVGGGMMGLLLTMLIASFDHRLRTVDDTQGTIGRLPLLGLLPRLPKDLADPEQAAVVAHCVHQIRILLQSGPGGFDRRVFAVTSPTAGSGKTSLTLALGVSFAASHARTLIVDADMVGGGLTAHVNGIIRRKIGQILKNDGRITDEQLDAALRLARGLKAKVGEVLVEQGYVSQEAINNALAAQQLPPSGILQALAGEPLQACVAPTGIAGLSILPIGAATADDVPRLSSIPLRRIIEAARSHFDVVLLDTGPIPGSLEASLLAPQVDGVIMVISRGEQRAPAEQAVQHLRALGARMAGLVFNRANRHEVEFFGSAARSVAASLSRAAQRPAADRHGAISMALAAGMPQPPNGNGKG